MLNRKILLLDRCLFVLMNFVADTRIAANLSIKYGVLDR